MQKDSRAANAVGHAMLAAGLPSTTQLILVSLHLSCWDGADISGKTDREPVPVRVESAFGARAAGAADEPEI